MTLYKNEIRKAHLGGWRAFCTELKGIPDTFILFKVLLKDGAKATGWVKDSNGNYPSDERGNMELLMRAHLPNFSTNYPSDLLASPRPSGTKLWAEGQEVVGKNRLDWAIGSFMPYKSLGPDGIFPALLQRGLDALRVPLTKLFRTCIALGHTPGNWYVSRMVFVPKGGRAGHSVPKDYRPISLTSFLLKTLERLVDRRISEVLVERHLFGA